MSEQESAFARDPIGPGVGWMTKCVGIAAIIGAGAFFGQLKNTCLVLLGGFTVIRGIVPFLSGMQELRTDQDRCAEEQEALSTISVNNVDQVRALSDEDDEAGSVFKMVQWIIDCRDRMAPETSVEVFLSRFDAYWEDRLSVLDEAADQGPVFGLGGSLLGLTAGLETFAAGAGGAEPGNPGVLFSALSTMCLTTLAGCGAYMIIAGLSRLAQNAVAHHRAALKAIGNQFIRKDDEPDTGDNDDDGTDDDDDLYDLQGAA